MIGRIRIANTVFNRGGAHFPDGHQSIDAAFLHKFLQVFMDMRSVRIKTSAVSQGVIFKDIRLGNNINYVEAKTVNALIAPKAHYVSELCADLRIVPVEIGL